jgi:hypothetical protein
MEVQIKKCLISLRKIAAVSDQWKIDSTSNEIEQHVDGLINNALRAAKGLVVNHRSEMVRVLNSKYSECREHVEYIIKSGNCRVYLPMIRRALLKSQRGLAKLQRNINYASDIKVKVNIDELVENEVPMIIKTIEDYITKNSKRFDQKALDEEIVDDPYAGETFDTEEKTGEGD